MAEHRAPVVQNDAVDVAQQPEEIGLSPEERQKQMAENRSNMQYDILAKLILQRNGVQTV